MVKRKADYSLAIPELKKLLELAENQPQRVSQDTWKVIKFATPSSLVWSEHCSFMDSAQFQGVVIAAEVKPDSEFTVN